MAGLWTVLLPPYDIDPIGVILWRGGLLQLTYLLRLADLRRRVAVLQAVVDTETVGDGEEELWTETAQSTETGQRSNFAHVQVREVG